MVQSITDVKTELTKSRSTDSNGVHAGVLAMVSLSAFLCISKAFAVQICNANAVATTPDSDFTVHNDGTVSHQKTGLMWKVCSEGQAWSGGACTGSVSTHTWDSALQIAATLNTSGGYPSLPNYTDWRLPNLKELKSIVELRCYIPAINETVFPNTGNSFYWSSSPVAKYGSFNAWGVYFLDGNGSYNFRDNDGRVRLVRSGQ